MERGTTVSTNGARGAPRTAPGDTRGIPSRTREGDRKRKNERGKGKEKQTTSRQTRRTSSFDTRRHGRLQIRNLRGPRGTETGRKGTKGDGDATRKENETGRGNKRGKGTSRRKNETRENKARGKQKDARARGEKIKEKGNLQGEGERKQKAQKGKIMTSRGKQRRKRAIESPTCIFDGPKRTLVYTPRDGGTKPAGKRTKEKSKYDVTNGNNAETHNDVTCLHI